MKKPVYIKNNQAVPVSEIPVLLYERFAALVLRLLAEKDNHCVSYYCYPQKNKLHFICCIARDRESDIAVFSHILDQQKYTTLISLSAKCLAMQQWEREISENYNITFRGHHWQKPVRFAHDQAIPANSPREIGINSRGKMDSYPFYRINSEELHEVGVGPIHAGIIEPGHFRFLCHGEAVLHLEIQLGYQHRGVEKLFLSKRNLFQQTVLAESIAGDTAIGHTLAFIQTMEALAGIKPERLLERERIIALELERIAVHVGDLSALCTDVAYQFGSAVLGALRTLIINYMQQWCGNRFGKGLLRAGYARYRLTTGLQQKLLQTLDDFDKRFSEMADKMFSLPSILHRFERTGVVTHAQAELIGAVGMTARMAGVPRDVRQSHPDAGFVEIPYEAVVLNSGDVFARAWLRKLEIDKSLQYIRTLLKIESEQERTQPVPVILQPEHFALSLVEGWRGEICHTAITDTQGALQHYKIVDPSFRNWLALALAVRNNEISDFPVCNKSFNLSYCGHDL